MNETPQDHFIGKLASYTPVQWAQIPDLGLYMDQVITFIERQYQALYPQGERILTPSMVNNYVKMGLVDRPDGKKYNQEHLAQLLMICVLKQAASAQSMKLLLKPAENEDLKTHYEHFCQTHTEVFTSLPTEMQSASPTACAVRAAAYRLLCNAILDQKTSKKQEDEQ